MCCLAKTTLPGRRSGTDLSQPSVSIQLARLREIFADPLLMPGPRGMQPTARADELRQPLRSALAALEQAVAPVSPF